VKNFLQGLRPPLVTDLRASFLLLGKMQELKRFERQERAWPNQQPSKWPGYCAMMP